MTETSAAPATLGVLNDATRALVRLAAIVTMADEPDIRAAMVSARAAIPAEWVEELVLQTYLFAGFPRGLNAMREWRRVQPEPLGTETAGGETVWRAAGVATCSLVYGDMYDRLRRNVRALHPLFDEWMIVEGYGKVLSRPALDLARRELCIVAACAASRQDRQLHSHLHGALNVGVEPNVVEAAIDAITDLLGDAHARSVRLLWARVRGK
jgi:4-carboxymuconolactone decarboxylase